MLTSVYVCLCLRDRQDPSLKKRLMEEMRTASLAAITQFPAAAVARQLFLEEWELFHSYVMCILVPMFVCALC